MVDSTATGPLGGGLSALLIGRSSSSRQGIFVMPGLIDADYEGIIKIMIKVFAPPVTITQGSRIAQLIPFCSQVPVSRNHNRGMGALGSTGNTAGPLVMFSTTIQATRPMRKVIISCKNETLGNETIEMMLDTGSDVTIIPIASWPKAWPLQSTSILVSGIGGESKTLQSVEFVCFKDAVDDNQAWVRPYVMHTPLWILGRDVMAQWGVTLRTQDF